MIVAHGCLENSPATVVFPYLLGIMFVSYSRNVLQTDVNYKVGLGPIWSGSPSLNAKGFLTVSLLFELFMDGSCLNGTQKAEIIVFFCACTKNRIECQRRSTIESHSADQLKQFSADRESIKIQPNALAESSLSLRHS
jgi:hypothetical protein